MAAAGAPGRPVTAPAPEPEVEPAPVDGLPAAGAVPPIHIYLQGGIASMATLPPMPVVKTFRQEAVIVLSVAERVGFTMDAEGHLGVMHAALVAPHTRFAMRSPSTATLSVYVHLVHPRITTLRSMAQTPLIPLDRLAFSHLNEQMQSAVQGGLEVEGGVQLIEDILGVVLEGVLPVRPLDPRVAWAMYQLEQNQMHPFEGLAAQLRLSPSRLSHLFSKELGISFRSYVAWTRLLLAWEMVTLKPEMSFTEIAHVMGYSDSSHMARAFHLSFGITPTMMRNRRLVRIVGRPLPPGQHLPKPEDVGALISNTSHPDSD